MNYKYPPTKSKVNALAHRIKMMRLPGSCETALLSALRALYVCPVAIMNMQTISHLQQVYYSLLDHYGISELDLLNDK